MIEITVKLQLDEASADTKRLLGALFNLPNASCYSSAIPEETEEAEQAKSQAADPQPEVKAEEAKPTPQPAAGPQPETKVEAKKSYKTEDVRAAMASKLADHRVELVNKLKEMGAKNVSSLPESKYEEFINFCNSL